MKRFFLSAAIICAATVLYAQDYQTLFIANGNTTGAVQNPLNLGNWSYAGAPQYKFYTHDLGGATPLQIHSTRWGGGITLTRNSPNGDVTMMTVSGWEGIGTSINLSDASNQVGALINAWGDSYLKNGALSIGTTDLPSGYKLAVNGSAIFTNAKVQLKVNWPDYVFQRDYHLLPLAELEKFIQQNNHLPEVPSAAEVEKEGLDLGSNQVALLKKIEELTLYIIEQNKRIEALEVETKLLRKSNNGSNH